MKQKLVDGGEYDCVYARQGYTIFEHAGVAKKIKTEMNRRFRHEARRLMREGRYDA